MLKEKLQTALGTAGLVIFYLISFGVFLLPLVMIKLPFWQGLLCFAILYFFNASSIVFWVWGLVCAIKGQQNAFAIIYYILFVILWIPSFISYIAELIYRLKK